MKIPRRVLFLVVIGALCLALLWGFNRYRRTTAGVGAGFLELPVGRGDLIVSISQSGPLEYGESREYKAPSVGTVAEVLVSEGQPFSDGDLLVTLRNSSLALELEAANLRLREEMSALCALLGLPPGETSAAMSMAVGTTLPVTSEVSGRVDRVLVKPGDEVRAGASLVELVDDGVVAFVVPVTEGEAGGVSTGDRVVIKMDEFDGTIQGTVSLVSQDPQQTLLSGGRYGYMHSVKVSVSNNGLLRSGMEGEAHLTLAGGSTVTRRGRIGESPKTVVRAGFDGEVRSVNVEEGVLARSGMPLLYLENADLPMIVESQRLKVRERIVGVEDAQERLDGLEIRAEGDGVVDQLFVTEGDPVERGDSLLSVNTARYVVRLQVEENRIRQIRTGLKGVAWFEAAPGERMQGEVTEIGLEGKVSGGVAFFDVEFQLDDSTLDRKGPLVGMTTHVEVVIEEVRDALLVPLEALQAMGDRTFVRRLQDGQPVLTPVTIGLKNDLWAQVLQGLGEGDLVIVADSSSSGNIMPFVMRGPGGVVPGTGGLGGTGIRPSGGGRQ